MKIGYLADGPWAHNAFLKLIEDKMIEISFITLRYDKRDPILTKLANQYNIPIIMDKNINSKEYMDNISVYNIDLLVSMSFNQILKKNIINYAPLKAINCHAGKLPYYRGRNILNWVLINDEKEFGITVHYIDEGIDTGDIILQKTYNITDKDDYHSLLNKAYHGCAEVLYDAIKMVQEGRVIRIKQNDIDANGMYCGMRIEGDEIIDWNQSSREVFNFVRALVSPGPRATTYINDNIIKINKVRFIEELIPYKGIPGQVIGKNGDKFLVKTKDTVVEVMEYESNELIRIGSRLKGI